MKRQGFKYIVLRLKSYSDAIALWTGEGLLPLKDAPDMDWWGNKSCFTIPVKLSDRSSEAFQNQTQLGCPSNKWFDLA